MYVIFPPTQQHDTGEDPKQHIFGYNAGNNMNRMKRKRTDGACNEYAFAMLLQVMVVLTTMIMMLATLHTMLLTTTVLMTSLVLIKCFMFVYLFIV